MSDKKIRLWGDMVNAQNVEVGAIVKVTERADFDDSGVRMEYEDVITRIDRHVGDFNMTYFTLEKFNERHPKMKFWCGGSEEKFTLGMTCFQTKKSRGKWVSVPVADMLFVQKEDDED